MAANGNASCARLDGGGGEEALSSIAQTAAAERLAEILVVGFGRCELAGRELTELQKIDLLAAALAAFDGHGDELASLFSLGRRLSELGGEDRERAGGMQRLHDLFGVSIRPADGG